MAVGLLLLPAIAVLLVPIQVAMAAELERDWLSPTSGLVAQFGRLSFLFLAVAATDVLLFVVWMVRSRLNLLRLRVAGADPSVGRTLIALLVPGVNVIRPLDLVDELWRASSVPVDFSDATSWRRSPSPWWIGAWWWLLVGLALLFCWQVSLEIVPYDSPGEAASGLQTRLAIGVTAGCLSLWTLLLVRTIDARQRERLRQIRAHYEARSQDLGSDSRAASATDLAPSTCLLGIAVALGASGVWASFVFSFFPAILTALVFFGTQASLLGAGVLIAELNRVPFRRLVPSVWPKTRVVFGGALTGLGVLLWNLAFTVPMMSTDGDSALLPVRELIPTADSMVTMMALLLVAVFVAPVIEEVLFRGVVFEALSGAWNPAVAIVGSAVLFALMHVEPVRLPVTFLIGIGCGLARQRSGSIVPAVALHAANNLAAVVSPIALHDGEPPRWLAVVGVGLVLVGLHEIGLWRPPRSETLRAVSARTIAAAAVTARASAGAQRKLHRALLAAMGGSWSSLVVTAAFVLMLLLSLVAALMLLGPGRTTPTLTVFTFLYLGLHLIALVQRRKVLLAGLAGLGLAIFSLAQVAATLPGRLFLLLQIAALGALFAGGEVRLSRRAAALRPAEPQDHPRPSDSRKQGDSDQG